MARASVIDAIELAKVCPGYMRHCTFVRTDTNVDGRFAEIDRFKLPVDVRHMDQRHISIGVKVQQLILRELLLGRQSCPVPKPRRPKKR